MPPSTTQRIMLVGGPLDGQCLNTEPTARRIVQLSSPGYVAIYVRDGESISRFKYCGSERIKKAK